MALIELTARVDLPAYTFVTTLDGTSYKLDLVWNERINNGVGKWMLQLADAQGNIIVSEVPVVATWPLFDRFRDPKIPKGTIFALDTSNKNEDPGRFDLGDRVRLMYLEENS